MSQVRFSRPATAKTGTTSSTTADTLSRIREGVKTLFQDTKEWAGYTALQTALLAPAYLEEIASGLLNAPNKAAIAGQHAARFRLTGDNDDLDKAAGTFALAALEASPLTGFVHNAFSHL